MSKLLKQEPQFVFKDGHAQSVILNILDFQNLLELAEDREDLKELKQMRKKGLRFRSFDEFLKEHPVR